MATMPAQPIPRDPELAIPILLDAYGPRIYGLGLQICGTHEDAEDLVQETFLNAFRNWSGFRGLSAPSTWLYTIAVRVCRRRRRRRSGEPSRIEPLNNLLPSDDEGVLDFPANDEGPLDALLREEARKTVQVGIAKIPYPFRIALVLKDLLDLPVAEIAAILGIKPGTVKTRVHRARLYLARELRKGLPKRTTREGAHDSDVCLVLLMAMQEALDNGRRFPSDNHELCSRCKSLFVTLELGRSACQDLKQGFISPRLREALIRTFVKPGAAKAAGI